MSPHRGHPLLIPTVDMEEALDRIRTEMIQSGQIRTPAFYAQMRTLIVQVAADRMGKIVKGWPLRSTTGWPLLRSFRARRWTFLPL